MALQFRTGRATIRPLRSRILPVPGAPDPANLPPLVTLVPPTNLASGETWSHLLAILDDYVDERITGRAVLVAGHRGVGKTTIVQEAIRVADLQHATPASRMLLPVQLYGPALFGLFDTANADSVEGILKEIAEGFYQSLRRALIRALETRALVLSEALARDIAEIAARMRLDGDQVDVLVEFRSLYERLGIARVGALRTTAARKAGMAELALFANLHRLHLYASGTLTVDASVSNEGNRERKAETKTEMTLGKEIVNPLTGVLSGALVGFSLLELLGPFSAMAGVLAAVGTTTALNFTASYLSKTSGKQSLTYKEDTSARAYARRLPVLIDQAVEIGILPVFVIDELDKVPDLYKKLIANLGNIKYLVNEKALFFFLCDPLCYMELSDAIRTAPHGKESTAFGDRIFLTYTPAELHAYLKRMLLDPEAPTPTESADQAVLPYVLLARSAMHPAALEQQIRRFTEQDGKLILAPGEIQENRFEEELLTQVGIEALLAEGPTRRWLEGRPEWRQLVYDALYMPLRLRRQLQYRFAVQGEALKTWLEETADLPIPKEERLAGLPLLEPLLKRLMGWLSSPAINKDRPDKDLPDAVRALVARSKPVVFLDGDYAEWERDLRGISRRSHWLGATGLEATSFNAAGVGPTVDPLQDAITRLDALDTTLAEAGLSWMTLVEREVVPASPPREAYTRARERLLDPDDPERAFDEEEVLRFWAMVQERQGEIQRVIQAKG